MEKITETYYVLADEGNRSFATTSGLTLVVMGAKLFATKSAATHWLLNGPTSYNSKLAPRRVKFNVEIG